MPSKSSGTKKSKNESGGRKKSKKNAAAKEKSSNRSPRRSAPGPVMGLDLSMGGCGVSVIKGKKVLHLDSLKTSPVGTNGRRGLLASGAFAGSDEERIAWITKKIRKIIHKHGVAFVVVEGHAFGARGRALTILHELHGVVKHYLLKEELAFVTIPPTEVKKFATGRGNADKQEMILAANEAGLPDVKDSDRADAFWCGRFGWDRFEDLTEE